MAEIRYPAFLSYSHRDQAVAEWLHHELETYRVPSRMVGTETLLGPVPSRLTPIFKDREELSAAGSLGDAITSALSRASALIVICSRASAASPWVNEEVCAFKKLHGHARIFAVIVDGEPGASRVPGREDEECFPPAVRFAVDDAGQITDTPAEPIAADLREGGDGKRLAKLKLIAGLLGVGLDEIVQREAQRRARRLRYLVAASLAGMTVTSGLAITAVMARDEAREQRNDAQHQRTEADGLVEFMLTDLRKKLEPVGRLDVMDTVGRRALAYYAAQNPAKLDPDALGRRSRALQLVAEVRNLRGDSEGALAAFKQAAATTGELLARQPNDGQRIFDHAQSVFWVGYIAWQRGDLKTGREFFSQYLARAQQLARIDPENDAWNGEVGYANQSLGILELDDNQPAKALQLFNNGEGVWARLAQRAKDKREPSYNLAQMLAWRADAERRSLDHKSALADRQKEAAIYRRLLAADPADNKAKEGLAVAELRTAQLRLEIGAPREAVVAADAGLDEAQSLQSRDPSNRLWQEIGVKAANTAAEAKMMTGDWAGAGQANSLALANAQRLVAVDHTVPEWRTDCLLPARWMEIAISVADGHRTAARGLIARFRQDFSWNDATKSADERFAWVMVETLDGIGRRAAGDEAGARANFQRAAFYLPKNGGLMDARLFGAARYLQRTTRVTGLPASAPAMAGRVQYNVGALLSSPRG
jgi:hypothetical protein